MIPKHKEIISDLNSNATFVDLNDLGHFPFLENSEYVAEFMIHWWDNSFNLPPKFETLVLRIVDQPHNAILIQEVGIFYLHYFVFLLIGVRYIAKI